METLKSIQLVMPNDLNPFGNLFGGTMMSWMDKLAAQYAMLATKCNCVTVSVDKINFIKPAKLGDSIFLEAHYLERGASSIKVSICACKMPIIGQPELITDAIFTFVALDENGKPNKNWKL